MTKRKKESKKVSKSQLKVVGSLLILIGIIFISFKYLYNLCLDMKEENKIKDFYEIQESINSDTDNQLYNKEIEETTNESKTDYIAVIKISKIGLEKGLCEIGSWCNSVNYNIEILSESAYPDITKGNFILAGHSGDYRTSYFRYLYKLSRDDEVSIFYQGMEYKYKVVNIYEIEKTGSADIVRNKEVNTLTLITCVDNTDKQMIVICELVGQSKIGGENGS